MSCSNHLSCASMLYKNSIINKPDRKIKSAVSLLIDIKLKGQPGTNKTKFNESWGRGCVCSMTRTLIWGCFWKSEGRENRLVPIIWLEAPKSRIQGPRKENWETKATWLPDWATKVTVDAGLLAARSSLYSVVEIVISEAEVVTWATLTDWDNSLALMRQFASTWS